MRFTPLLHKQNAHFALVISITRDLCTGVGSDVHSLSYDGCPSVGLFVHTLCGFSLGFNFLGVGSDAHSLFN